MKNQTIVIKDRFKNSLPPLTQEEYHKLEMQLVREGCRDALLLWGDILIDGHNRYSICTKHNLPFTTLQTLDFKNEDEAEVWQIEYNLGRRNLNDHNKVMVALKRQSILDTMAQGKEKQVESGRIYHKGSPKVLSSCDKTLEPINTQKAISEYTGISTGQVAKIQYIEKHGDEKEKDMSRKGKTDKAYKEIKNKKYKASEAIKKDVSTINITSDLIKGLHNCDILDAPIADNSLDAIITDPPYPKEYLDCWTKLAKFAQSKLKEGGILLAMSGQSYLPDVYKNMTIEGLNYYWTCCIKNTVSADLREKRTKTQWKPLLWYVKGKYSGTYQGTDVFTPTYNDTVEGQDFHKWGQSIPLFSEIISKYTYADAVICDPFLGGGTTALACIENKRHFIGIELLENVFNTAKARINEKTSIQ